MVLFAENVKAFYTKRLKAIKQRAKNVSPWKLGALGSLLVILFVVFACSEEVDKDIKKMGESNNTITFDQLPIDMQEKLVDIKDKLVFTKLTIESDETGNADVPLSRIEGLQGIDPNTIHMVNVDKANQEVYIAIKREGANFDYIAEKSKMDGEVFTIVEDQPEYEGGIDAFYQYIGNEISYPLEARQSGVEGRVFVQFVVEKDGSISEVTTVKGIGSGCDEEAERVIQNAGRFKPGSQRGKPVRVRMVMPIVFKLDHGKTNPDNSTQGMVILEDVETNKNGKLNVDASFVDGEWSGTVYSPEGNVIAGASILVAGTTTGTVSDSEGKFRVKSDQFSDINISFVGYETVRFKGK